MDSLIKEIVIDGNTTDKNPANLFGGLGTVFDSRFSALLMDYKVKSLESYNEIMELLFKPDYGAGLTHVRILFDSDYLSDLKSIIIDDMMLLSDAKKINPEMTVDLTVKESYCVTEDGFEMLYHNLKEFIDSVYDSCNMKIDSVSSYINQSGWIAYLSQRLKSEKNCRYDYSKIKITALQKKNDISKLLVENEQLRNVIDIVGIFNAECSDENVKLLNEKYGKEIWCINGCSPCNVSEYSFNSDGSGISGKNSLIDVTNCMIDSFCKNFAVMYEYNPAILSCYTGSENAPKYLITAQQPWSGYYEIGSGLWGASHLTHFVKSGWKYVKSGCLSDTDENHVALVSDEGDYTMIFTNDTDTEMHYNVCIRNIVKADSIMYCVETRGSDDGRKYDSSWFRVTDKIIPARNKTGFFYRLDVRPHSILTCTSLNVENVNGVDSVKKCEVCKGHLEIPYTDNFDYSELFLKKRGGVPLYINDHCGSFEVKKYDGYGVLEQTVQKDTADGAYADFGDDCWSNYSLKTEILLENSSEKNYVGIAVRCNCDNSCSSTESGYQIRIYGNGKWQLRFLDTVLEEGIESSFNAKEWTVLKIIAKHNKIKCILNKQILCEHTLYTPMIVSGRAAVYSAYCKNKFKYLSVSPVSGTPSFSVYDDCLSGKITFSDGWIKNAMDSEEFNNLTSVSTSTENTYFEYEFFGETISLMGMAENLRLKIEIDEKIMTAGMLIEKCDCRQVFYYKKGLLPQKHKIKVIVLSGKLSLDTIITDEKEKCKKIKISDSKKNEENNDGKIKKSTLLIGAGLAAAGAGAVILGKLKKKRK